MMINSTPILIALGLLGAQQDIDTFRYADAAAARAAWTAHSGTPAVQVVQDEGRPVLEVRGPFASDAKLDRTIIDKKVKLDLAAPGGFTLEVCADQPTAFGHISLYFESEGGWYAGGAGLTKPGWQTLHFSKASFRPEHEPAGWDAIRTVRISLWRGQPQDVKLRIRGLASVTREVGIVIPSAKGQSDAEIKTALEVAERVALMLHGLGLGSDAIDEAAVAKGALGSRCVAILPYNPRLSTEAVAALEKFVSGGGKLLVCYSAPARLAKLLGIKSAAYVSQKRTGQFAEMRFDAGSLPGLPQAARQASWNITDVEPGQHNARIIGRWYDDEGRATGQAALLLSDHGAFLSHILMGDDYDAKKQLLAAILGHFSPLLWQQMAQAALDGVNRIGHIEGWDSIAAYVKANARPEALARLESASKTLDCARQQLERKAYPESIDSARKGRQLLAEAYLRAQSSPAKEGRAVWNHSGTGAYPGDWERSAKELAAAGFNMVLPNMLWAGRAYYPSDVLPRASTYEQYGDQIAQCLAAAKKHGLEVHVWKVNWNLSGAPKEFVEKLRSQGRTMVTAGGQPHDWLCPSNPENFKLELESMLEVARKYAVDGLHFDYIRYPGPNCCFCDACRQRFEKESSRPVADWPKDCLSGERRDEYCDWRCKQITRLVEAVHREGKKIRPGLKISAAVFGAYPDCRRSVGQDWVAWIKAGYLDFVCPMDYQESDLAFSSLVENQLRLVEGRIPVYPGIGAAASRSLLTPDRVVGQVFHARRLGAAGFTIFDFQPRTVSTIIPGVGLGAGAQQAVPPHRRSEK